MLHSCAELSSELNDPVGVHDAGGLQRQEQSQVTIKGARKATGRATKTSLQQKRVVDALNPYKQAKALISEENALNLLSRTTIKEFERKTRDSKLRFSHDEKASRVQ